MVTHDTNLQLGLSSTGTPDVCSLLFDDAICDLRPGDPRLLQTWMFTLRQAVTPTTNTPATVFNQLRLAIGKFADSEVSITVRAGGHQERLDFPFGEDYNENQLLEFSVPAVLADNAYNVRFDIQARRKNTTDQVLVTFDSLDIRLE